MRRDGGGVEGEEVQTEEKERRRRRRAVGMVDEYRCPGDLLSFKLRKGGISVRQANKGGGGGDE